MKTTARSLLILAAFLLVLPSKAIPANLDWLGIVSGFGGAERESIPGKIVDESSFGEAGGRGTAEALALIPFGPFGVQGAFHYTGGSGSRFGTTFGPLYDFTAGKVGVFATYQHRNLRDGNFWWIEPALDWYLDQINLSLRYLQPASSVQSNHARPCKSDDTCVIRDLAINKLQATASYFPRDFLQLGKDNLEVTAGVQVNSFAGPRIRGAGVGPVFGLAMSPAQNIEVTLIKGTVDNRSRYEIQSGIRIFFGSWGGPSTSTTNSPSLMELRRKYMEASSKPVSGYTRFRSSDF